MVLVVALVVAGAYAFQTGVPARTQTKASAMSKVLPWLEAPEKLDGTMIGDTGFDPLGISVIQEDLKYARAAEIKHGRIAMLACTGLVVKEYVTIPGYPSVGPIDAVGAVPLAANLQILLTIAVIELSTIDKIYGDDGEPGDYGFDPSQLITGKSDEYIAELKSKELFNGRLAMMAFIGMLVQMLWFQRPILDVFHPVIQIEDICKGLGKIRKIKVYRDAGGIPKGDATVVFEQRKSRDVAAEAVAELDGKRIDQGTLGSYVIAVQEATFKPVAAPQRPKQPPAAPQRVSYAPPDAPKVLLRNLFDAAVDHTPDQRRSFEDEVGLECTKHGRVLDAEYVREDAAILVTFAAVEAARLCATAMQGRFFDRRVIRAELWPDGKRQKDEEEVPPPAKKQNIAGDYVGAPPPRNAEPPPKYVEPPADQPTARMRAASSSATTTTGPTEDPRPLKAFVRANHSVEGADAEPPRGHPTNNPKKRTAADFFDD
ncbi:hypothetical protein CTAYLR_003262 [Chrysophaeum taylorii]|uniref:RRM domain-containing protein n=1 Tax=Chrysophaeum taylorii TaxID=2483200 RepID=A0AAD7UAB1_9STRA|nr:hypothetical protein CTAYLR_003262 [Chrysophaeum taylorii]